MAADRTRLPDPLNALEAELLLRESLERGRGERAPLDLAAEPERANQAWPARSRPALTIILPVYNEERRLEHSFRQLGERAASEPWGDDFELIVVDDGSTDATVGAAEREAAELDRARVVRLPWHAGKGAAVRLGMTVAHGDAIVFMDADLATDLGALAECLEALRHADVVVGSRKAPGAVVTGRTRVRSMLHRGFGSHARRLASVPTDDPQCGFKAFRSEAGKVLFSMSRVDGFGFDVEILLLAQKLGYRIAELPVRWHAVDGSHVHVLRDPLMMFRDLVQTRRRYRRKVALPSTPATPARGSAEADPRPQGNGRGRFVAHPEPSPRGE